MHISILYARSSANADGPAQDKTAHPSVDVSISIAITTHSSLCQIKFLFDGQRINADDTPAKHEMDDNDAIDVLIEQVRFIFSPSQVASKVLMTCAGWRKVIDLVDVISLRSILS